MSIIELFGYESQLSKAQDIYQKEGLRVLFTSIKKYIIKYIFYTSYGVGMQQHSSRIRNVEEKTTHCITYDGIHSPPHPNQIQAHPEEIETFPINIFEFKQCAIVGGYPTIYTGTTWIRSFPGAPLEHSVLRVMSHTIGSLAQMITQKQHDEVIVLASGNSGYAHWPSEVLAKFRAIENSDIDTAEVQFIVPPDLNDWQRESLELIGYPVRTVNQIEYEHRLTSQTVVIPSTSELLWTGPPYVSPSEIEWIREQVLSQTKRKVSHYGKRLFVSRVDANKRNIVNRDEVLDALSHFDIDVIIPGKLSYSEQVTVFSRAELIVGPHGAGLTNIMYSQEATVVELLIEDIKNKHYYVLSNLSNLQYDYVWCERQKDEQTPQRHSNMIVDIEELKQTISHYL